VEKLAVIGVVVFSQKGIPELKAAMGKLKGLGSLEKVSSIYSIRGTHYVPDQIHDLRTDGQFIGLSLALTLHTADRASELLSKIKMLESELTSTINKRSLELILMVYEGEAVMTPNLTLPYPDLLKRPEITIPAAETWGDYYHPVYKESLNALAKRSAAGSWGEFFAHSKSALDF
tara:strand:- start:75465 stop:75989 length:525 start_codon:yes stop_codon:yes gene_type:complete